MCVFLLHRFALLHYFLAERRVARLVPSHRTMLFSRFLGGGTSRRRSLSLISGYRAATFSSGSDPPVDGGLPPPPPSQANALDQSIIMLAEVGPSHLPKLFQELMKSNVFYITQTSESTAVQDALTFPSLPDGVLHPSFFSSPWAAQRYLMQHNLTEALDQATTQEISAREFLQQTRPATILFNPPVFTLTPETIASLLEDNGEHRVRLEPHFPSMRYKEPNNVPSTELVGAIQDVLERQQIVVAAYMLEYQLPDDLPDAVPQQVLACLCGITQADEFESIENDLIEALRPHNVATLCLNLVPDTKVLEFAVDRLVPVYLHVGNMSDIEFQNLFINRVAVGAAPPLSPVQRQALLSQITQHQALAAYQIVYQIAGHRRQVGTFYDVKEDNTYKASFTECLHRGWGYLRDLPPEMADYIRQNVTPFYEKTDV